MLIAQAVEDDGAGSQACPACGGSFRRRRHIWLFECERCGLLHSSLQPHIPATESDSVVDEVERLAGLTEPRRKSNRVILDMLSEHLKGAKEVLDVGCGHGLFLEDAARRGFSAQGIEPDANVFKLISEKGLNARHGYFPDVLRAGEAYDAIVFNDVLEHIPDTLATVRACWRHLRPGGILVMNCPSRDGVFYRLAQILDRLGFSGPFDRLWQRGLPSPHLWYFMPADLVRIARNEGFEPRKAIRLTPIGLNGLKQRIFYVEGQSPIVSYGALVAALFMLPLLRFLPKDVGIAFVSKPT